MHPRRSRLYSLAMMPTAIPDQNITSEELLESLVAILPDLTFEEAFEQTGRQLNVSVAPLETMQTSRLLNAITSPNVYIREAVMASCAIPGIYPPVTLMAKNDHGERQAYLPSRQWVDGSVSDDLPAKRLARLYGANHYIVSQTNPHVLPFLAGDRDDPGGPVYADGSREYGNRAYMAGMRVQKLPESPLREAKRSVVCRVWALSVINQEYQGDITILPNQRFMNPFEAVAYSSTG